jgi:hypothetical protein
MKKTITLTKMLTLAILLVTFATASATDGDGKCKTKCCKEKKNKEVMAAIAEMEKALNKLEAEFKTVSAVMVTTEVKRSFAKMRTITMRPVQVFAFAAAATTGTDAVDAKYKINFNDLDNEMDKEQEKMTAAPDLSQKVDFSNLDKEMNDVQERLSSWNGSQL